MGIRIFNLVVFAFAAAGAFDHLLLEDRLGLGRDFVKGLACIGNLVLTMTGFMAVAPILAEVLSPVVSPFFASFGADPSVLGGLLLANDSGGASLAAALCKDPSAGILNGHFLASMMGGATMCVIPMTFLYTDGRTRTPASYGMIIGLFTIPFGVLAGGLSIGMRPGVILSNLVPAIVLSAVFFVLLIFFPKQAAPIFNVFGKLLMAVNLSGLVLTCLDQIAHIRPAPLLTPFEEIIPVIGNMSLFLGGMFPLLALLRKLFRRILARAAAALRISEEDMAGLFNTGINIFPTFEAYKEMTERGVLLNCAFMMGAACLIGDHLAFSLQVVPELAMNIVFAQAVSAFLGLAAAVLLAPRLLEQDLNSKTISQGGNHE